MTHQVNSRIERLVRALQTLKAEIEPYLHLISEAARDEWKAIQDWWPTDHQLREGTTTLSEGLLELTEAKVRRFRDIVHDLASLSRSPRAPRLNLAERLMPPLPTPDQDSAE